VTELDGGGAPALDGPAIDAAIAALRAGLVVLLPTDTVYGLAVDPTVPGATGRLFEVKQRPTDVALPVLASDVVAAFGLAGDVPELARRLAGRFWPGGLTLVLARRRDLGIDLGGPDHETIGLRVPDDPVVRAITAAVGPLAVTSANLHGRSTPATAAGVLDQLGDLAGSVAAVVDAGPRAGEPSTVVRVGWTRAEILRPGAVPASAIADITGAVH
jgi:L-threonylcarbamoyladenylate synthase